MFSKGNESDKKKLDLFRQYHCSDCLKSFQHNHNNHLNQKQEPTSSHSQSSSSETSQGQMNTPPAPLQDLAEETFTGLYTYFGADSSTSTGNQHDIQQQLLLEQPTHQLYDSVSKINHQESSFQLNNTYNSSISSVSTSVSQLDSEPIDDNNSDTLSQMSIQNKRQSNEALLFIKKILLFFLIVF